MHFVHRFDFGGLENGLVNIINGLPHSKYRHTIVAMTEIGEISKRISASNVNLIALNKQPGLDLPCYWKVLKLIRKHRPDVVHTRNLGTLEVQLLAWFCATPLRIHSEHGRDIDDPDGKRIKPRILRKLFSPLLHRWVCVSKDLLGWCQEEVGISKSKLLQICNGVDIARFKLSARPAPYTLNKGLIFGSVTRFNPIKDPLNVIKAFAKVNGAHSLVMVGDGPLFNEAQQLVERLGLEGRVDFRGAMTDTADAYGDFDVFVLGSKREGISNTILEAMASGKPVIATKVGGNLELVSVEHGKLVPPENAEALSEAMQNFVDNPEDVCSFGTSCRHRAEVEFSLEGMCKKYDDLYSDR